MKKIVLVTLTLFLLSGCSTQGDKILLFSRESASGTREQFVNALEITENGLDATDTDASVTNSSAVILSAVASNKGAIGYVSLPTVTDKVKAVAIDGNPPDFENVKNGSYPLKRTFYLVYNTNKISDCARDFLSFVQSAEGNKIIKEMGYMPLSKKPYRAAKVEGKTVLAGSASVAPLMERLRARYAEFQKGVQIEIQQNDSTTGISLLGQDIVEVGMSSRDLKRDEHSKDYEIIDLAQDIIAVIVHPENQISDLSRQELKEIFSEKIKFWSELNA